MKRITILPLSALLLCSCSCAQNGSTTTSTNTSSSLTPTNQFYPGEVEPGAEHNLPWNLNYELFKSENGALDYASYHKTYEFDGTNVYCYGMRAVTDISTNVNGSMVSYSGFKIIHFAKVGQEKFPAGGQIQISDLKPQRLVAEIVSHSKYTYASSSAPTIYIGDRIIHAPSTPEAKTPSPLHEEFNIFTVIYEINATEPGIITIKSDQSFSMYIQSLQFE